MGVVYCATNRMTGKCYVGKCTSTMHHRRLSHEGSARRGSSACPSFYAALREFGPDSFDWEVLFESSLLHVLGKIECDFIRDFDCRYPKGYNHTPGNDGAPPGSNHSEETRAKMREARKKQKPHSAETRARISRAVKSRSQDVRDRQAASLRAAWTQPHMREQFRKSHIGKKDSEETRKRKSESARNKPPITEETRQRMSVAARRREHKRRVARESCGI